MKKRFRRLSFAIFAACTAFIAATRADDRPPRTGPAHGPVFEGKELTQIPIALAQVPPDYPPDLKKSGLEGRVVLSFLVTEKGAVADVRLVEATNDGFVQAAANAVYRWKFRPGNANGKAVCTRLVVPVVFTLVAPAKPAKAN